LFEQTPYSRDVHEVTGLAITPPQAREDAQDLAITLRREDCGGA
jgi:hypothetical protein